MAAVESAELELWARFKSEDDQEARDELARRYSSWVASIAHSVHRRVWAYPIDAEDFVQNAKIGMLEAMIRFDPDRGVPFPAYAKPRIRGAVFNGLRAILGDRAVQNGGQQRFIERSSSLHEIGSGDAFVDVVDAILGLGIGYMLDDVAQTNSDTAVDGLAYTQATENRIRLMDAMDQLPDRLRSIVHLHYFKFVPFNQIAEEWQLTKGRISQLHKAALENLREKLREIS
jgi:RNA polymerase sigma factor for flagellar operon FliA